MASGKAGQEETRFRTRLLLAVAYPLVLMAVSATLLVWQIGRLNATVRRVEQSGA